MILVPLFLALLSARLILINYEQDHQLQILEAAQDVKIQESIDFMKELDNTLNNSPDSFINPIYLKSLTERLSNFQMEILIQYNGQYLDNSVSSDIEKLKPYLSKFRQQDITNRWASAITKDYIVKCRTLSYKDGTTSLVYLFMKRTPPLDIPPPAHTEYVKWIFFILIIGIFLTNSLLTYYMTKCLLKPLDSVINAAKEIQKGNLDHPISYPVKNEIGELFQAFEEMRLTLKELQALNLLYEKSRQELISNISHDIKTPITLIKGYAQGIIDGVANNPEKIEKYLRTILKNASEMERLTNDLTLFSKLDIKQLSFTFEGVDIEKYFEDAIEELNFSLNENDIILNFKSYYDSKALVMADRQRLIRVIYNLIENAKKHLNKQIKTIEIILKEDPINAVIEVRDNGCGIPRDKLPLIFDRFFRVDNARNRATGGSGIGLSIANEIIAAHQGKIWAESTEGLGTSIYFTLKKSPIIQTIYNQFSSGRKPDEKGINY